MEKVAKQNNLTEILNLISSHRIKHNWLKTVSDKHSNNIKAILDKSSLFSVCSAAFGNKNPTQKIESSMNLCFCLFQAFLINMSYTVSLSSYRGLIQDIDPSFANIGFVISLNTFAELLFMLVLACFPAVKGILSFNTVNLVFIASYSIYLLSYAFKSVFLVCLSRLTMGLLGGEMFSREYLLSYSAGNSSKMHALAYLGVTFFGLASGLVVDFFSNWISEVEIAGIRLYSNNLGAVVGMAIYAGFAVLGFLLFKTPVKQPFRPKIQVKVSSDKKSLLPLQNYRGETAKLNKRSQSILLFVVFLVKVLNESNLVSSLIISDQFYQGTESKPYKTLIISAGLVSGVLVVAFTRKFLIHLRNRQITVLAFMLVAVGIAASSSLLADCKYAYGAGFVIIISFIPLLELSLVLQEQSMSEGIFLSSAFTFTLTSHTAKIIGSNLTDTFQFISNYQRLNEVQSIANIAFYLVPLALFLFAYKNII